ncbi:MAG: PAS domain S-box protein [Rubrivivax sp.]
MSPREAPTGLSLRAGAFWLAVLTLLPATLLGVVAYRHDVDDADAEGYARARLLAAGAAQALEWELGGAQALLATLAQRPEARSLDARGCQALLADVGPHARDGSALALLRADGSQVCPGAASGAGAPPSPATPRTFPLTQAVTDGAGRPIGRLQLSFDPERLGARLFRSVPAGAQVAVLGADGRVLLQSPGAGAIGAAPVPGGGAQAFERAGADGVRRYHVVQALRTGDWRVLAVLPADPVLSQRAAEWRNALVVMVAGVLAAFALAALLLRRVLVPLRALADTAQAVSAGDAQARAPVQGPRELRHLTQTFNDMLDVKQTVESALAESEARFRTLSALSSDWYWEQDAEGRIVSISESIVDHVGFTREQHLGRRRWELPWVDMDEAQWAAHRATLERHEPFHDFEIVRPAPDGLRRHVLISGVPLFDARGRFTGYRGVGREITRQRRDEQALAEREHRHRRLIDHLPVAVVLHAADDRVRLFNAEACRLLGLSAAQLTRGERPPRWQMLDEDGRPLPPAAWPAARVRDGGAGVSGQVVGIRAGDEPLRWAMVNAYPEFDARGALESVVVAMVDITARQQAEALRQEREKAEAASRAKSDFVSHMSHELRTPLNAVLGFAEVLRADPALRGQVRAQRHLGHIRQAGAHLLALVNDLLDIARIEGRVLRVRSEPVRLAPLIDECVALHAPAARDAAVDLQQGAAIDPALSAQADPDRLRQVLNNLVANAIKYNRRGGRVRLEARRDGDQVCVEVSDTGLGLGPEQRAQLFQPYNRLGAESLGIEGTGLGLLIARELAQAMGGQLQVDGEAGVGSTFRLVLAAARAPAAAGAEGAPAPPAAAGPDGLLVLCVDADAAGRELQAAAFAAWPGTRAELAATVDDALAAAARRRPDLVLVDLGLPRGDAAALLQRLADGCGGRRPPCIALSARVADADRRSALQQGFDAWVGKPYGVTELLDCVRRVLN